MLMHSLKSFALAAMLASWRPVDAFTTQHTLSLAVQSSPTRRAITSKYQSASALQMSANQFDVSKPVFDLFALRQIRGDALLQYNALNQSEPLRINIYGLVAVACFSAPLVSEAVGGEPLTFVATAASTLAGFGSVV